MTPRPLRQRLEPRVRAAATTIAIVGMAAIASMAIPGCCRTDRTAHLTSATEPSLSRRRATLERYVTFRRTYAALDYAIDFDDDTSLAPGPSTVRCDIRIHAMIPPSEGASWIAGLERDPTAATSPRPDWLRDVPGAPSSPSLTGFSWYRDAPSPANGQGRAGRHVGISVANDEVVYRHVCAPN